MDEDNSSSSSTPENPSTSATPKAAEPTLDTKGPDVPATTTDQQTSIGPYQLLYILGEGGMGQVWLAEQTSPVKRRVALKLIKGGKYDNHVILRFESERQSLALMNHPVIAKIFDAGSTQGGQPYFVMEYVDGPSITRYCDNKKLKIRERLQLFIKVCEGVQHAHQKAIIHRDLKPSNVLVEEVDGKPVPRIIDFGIAKAVSSQQNADQTLFTQMGALVGTPGFMSPEQADPSVLDIDTRTDVYSLGVILYVLLTGTLPFEEDQWRKRPFDEILRQLRQEDPPSPSARISAEKKTATGNAANRSTDQRQLVRTLRGDLDWITMKALEKDRARRYGTPTELAADVQRYLESQPVTAHRTATSYRLKKYIQRHRLGVAVAAAVAAMLVAFAVMQTVQLRRTTRERDRANRIAEFMKDMFKVSDPSESRGASITAREILDQASTKIDAGLAQDPEVRTQLMDLMGTVYQRLGLYSRAQPLLERAVDTQKRILGPEKRETLVSMSDLAWTLDHEGKYAEAEKLERQALNAQRRVLGSENKETLITMNNLGWTFLEGGKPAEAEKVDRDAIAIESRVFGPADTLTIAAMSNLGVTLFHEQKLPEAEKVQTEVLELNRRVLGPENPDTLQTMDNLAITLFAEERNADAEKLQRQTLEIERRVLGPDHPFTAETLDNLAMTLLSEGRSADAEQFQREALETERRVLGPEHPDTLMTMRNIAITLSMEGRFDEGEKLARQTLEIQQRVLGPAHPETLKTMRYFALLYNRQHRYPEAEQAQRQMLDVEQRYLGPENPATLSTMESLALICLSEKKDAEAESIFSALRDIQLRILGPNDPSTAGTTYNLACIAARAGKKDQALAMLQDSLDHGLSDSIAVDMDKDTDLNSFHGDPRFTALVAAAKQRATATQKPK